jgi:hypothetical protein
MRLWSTRAAPTVRSTPMRAPRSRRLPTAMGLAAPQCSEARKFPHKQAPRSSATGLSRCVRRHTARYQRRHHRLPHHRLVHHSRPLRLNPHARCLRGTHRLRFHRCSHRSPRRRGHTHHSHRRGHTHHSHRRGHTHHSHRRGHTHHSHRRRHTLHPRRQGYTLPPHSRDRTSRRHPLWIQGTRPLWRRVMRSTSPHWCASAKSWVARWMS